MYTYSPPLYQLSYGEIGLGVCTAITPHTHTPHNPKIATPERFELSRAEPTNLAGWRLNHSAKVPLTGYPAVKMQKTPRRGIEPRASA